MTDVIVLGLGADGSAAAAHLPRRCIAAHLSLAERHGAELRFDERVTSWTGDGDGVRVVTDRAAYRADRLVISAGAWTARLLPTLAPLLEVHRVPAFWFEPRAEREALARLPVYMIDA